MLEIARKALLLLGLIHGPQALATEANDVPVVPGVNQAQIFDLPDLGSLAVVPVRPTGIASGRHDWQEAAFQLEFRDSSALGQIRGIRGLSFLTLAETKGSRLFLGMNKRGLFGLHFSSTRHGSADRVVEIARMPYIKREEPVAALSR